MNKSGKRKKSARNFRIVIGYDGTSAANKLLRDLDRAALPAIAEVTVLSVVEPWARFAEPLEGALGWPSAAALDQYQLQLGEIQKAARQKANRAAKSLARRFPGWKIEAQAELDPVAHGLLSRAERWKADLIVVGSHGRGFLGRALLGSVSDKVVHHAGTNVRVSRVGSITRAYPPRVIVAVDGSPSSLKAAEAASRRRWPKGTQVQIIGVIDPTYGGGSFLGAEMSVPTHLGDAELRTWLEKKLKEAGRKFAGSGIKPIQVIHTGDARQVILKEAKIWKADCIFLGASGLSGVERLFVGSVTSALAAHAPCSVEIVRSRKKSRN